MSEPVYFVVTSRAGLTSAALHHGQLPAWMTGKRAKERGLVYALRLDVLPNAARWLAMSANDLHRVYLTRKTGSTLPPSNIAPPPAAKVDRKAKVGDYWKPPPPTWDSTAPGLPHPQPDAIRPKLAPAPIRETSSDG